jgi:hypothetical protein
MEGDLHPAAAAAEELLRQCETERLRRSGPGGQHRNKVETAIRLRHRPTGVRAEASERRSQAENRRVALARLRIELALQIRSSPEPGQPASSLWRSRLSDGRISVNAAHEDFPALLAEALDRIAVHQGDVKPAAESLLSTSSQLVKLLKKEPRALALVNRWRAEHGLAPLR